jgi:2-phospho-L-lactate guanylyltransferase
MRAASAVIWGVVPAKRFDAAKSRLARALSPTERAAFARSCFEHVIGVLARSPALSGVIVVTDSADLADLAASRGAVALRDPENPRTLAAVVDHALDELVRRRADSAIMLVSDLPEVTDDDVGRLVAELERSDVVLARDAGGAHTNALALRLGSGFRTSFGADDSLRRHRETAERAGLRVSDVDSPTLAFDVDTPEDYARFVARR